MKRSPALVCLLLALGALGAYWGVMRNDFVNYDDSDYVTANPHVERGLTKANIVWAFTTGHASNWHPLTWLSHMLDCQLFGENPGPPHLVNVGFHVANALLVFLLLRRVTGTQWRSAAVAALFALHPLHVESVAWISERKDVLSTFFFLLTLWAYARYAELDRLQRELATVRPAKPNRTCGKTKLWPGRKLSGAAQARVFYVSAIVWFALGLMSKPMLVTVPFLLLLLDYWPFRRLLFPLKRQSCPGLLRLLSEKAPFFALAAVSSIVTFQVQRQGGAVSTSISLGARLGNAVVSYARYLGKTVWPLDLAVLYPHPGFWPWWQVALCGALLAGLSLGVFWFGRSRPWLVVGWLWFVGTLVPVIGLVQVGIQSMADRYTYIPHIGLFIAGVWGLYDCFAFSPRRKAYLGIAGAAALAACALLTARQVGFWHDSFTLFERTVQVTANNYLAYNNLGFFYSNKGQVAEAMTNYAKALEINPNYEDALNNMGYALAGLKRYPEAVGYYERALRMRPNFAEVRNNLGNALSEMGQLNAAIEQYLLALKESPEYADAHNNLGIALAMQGKLEEAIPHFRDAIRFKPKYASAYSNLGNALAAKHELPEAIVQYEASLALNPKDPQAHNNLGNALSELGKLDEAVPHYAEALRLNPQNPEAHFNLGMALARQGKRAEAQAELEEALRQRPNYPEARQMLDHLSAANAH